MDVVVDENNLAIAIGRNGQNVKLASELTGWAIKPDDGRRIRQRSEQEHADVRARSWKNWMSAMKVADILIDEVSRPREMAYVPLSKCSRSGLRRRYGQTGCAIARNVLLTEAIVTEEQRKRLGDLLPLMEWINNWPPALHSTMCARATILPIWRSTAG